MSWTPLLLLLALCPGSRSQAVVTQEPGMTVSPGGTVTLTCGSSTGAVTDGHYPYWIQQKPGQVPRTLIYNTDKKHSWTPARFSGSIQGGKAALTLSGAQPEDEAEYYCWLYFSGAHHKSRSQAVVTQEPEMTVSSGGTVTLTCGSSTGAVTDGHYPYWFQQTPGHTPRTLIYNTNNRHSWTPARFSGSIRGGKAALTLAGAQPEDEAVYHCWLVYSGARHRLKSGQLPKECSLVLPKLSFKGRPCQMKFTIPAAACPGERVCNEPGQNRDRVQLGPTQGTPQMRRSVRPYVFLNMRSVPGSG
ncbi:Ig lambda chain V region 4A [Myotis brandtii]|uniref:Ig lambda chain V region 4A n=1 Tax=Myotis brandtii TaxID=109478 RepID=S7NAV7_MYOBR|nr:Ig lambda chain V region 4A [Myotis brandtii]